MRSATPPHRRPLLVGLLATVLLLASTLIGVGGTGLGGIGLGNIAHAQDVDVDDIVQQLESDGFYIEDGADGDRANFVDLVAWADGRADGPWYFVSMCCTVDQALSDEIRDQVNPKGNVVLFYYEEDGDGLFEVGQLASNGTEAQETNALDAALGDQGWADIDDFMRLVVGNFDRAGQTAGSSGGSSSTTDAAPSSGGRSAAWIFVPVVAVGGGAMWFVGRRSKKKRERQAEAREIETAQKIRAEIQTELDELANDVIVLSSPVDLSDNTTAIQHYRDATETFTEISDKLPDPAELEGADLQELSELGARISYARWQMDAAEAIVGGEPIPDKPQVAPPPAPPKPPTATRPKAPRIDPTRQPRPRVPYSRSRQRSGGGLLDILIAGAGMLGGSRGGSYGGGYGRSGGMFGGGSRSSGRRNRPRTNRPRSGGGVFGGGSSAGSSSRSSGRSSGSSSSRSSSRRRSSSSARRRSTRSRRSSGSSRRGRRR